MFKINSLQGRLLLAIVLVLAAFVALTGLALEQAYSERARQAEHDKLQGLIYGVLGAAEVGPGGRLSVRSSELPDERLRQPDSGLYFMVRNADGVPVWRSSSLIGALEPEVFDATPAVGEWHFNVLQNDVPQPLFALAFGVRWLREGALEQRYTFVALEDAAAAKRQLQEFRKTLWAWLIVSALLLLIVQWLVLRWGLAPLKRLTAELRLVETGDRDRIEGPYPEELRPLTTGLNTMLRHERSQQARYRNALDDLAHSLKTPLAVLRGLGERKSGAASEIVTRLDEQVARMDRIVEYQLRKAATAGGRALRRPVLVRPLAEKIANSLAKVYRDKAIEYRLDVPAGFTLRADTDDLMELLGNLLDNASKWCKTTVRLRAAARSGRLELVIEDDGPGLPPGREQDLLLRGARADTRIDGQGIGLAVSAEIVRAYEGELRLESSSLGGARISIVLPLS